MSTKIGLNETPSRDRYPALLFRECPKLLRQLLPRTGIDRTEEPLRKRGIALDPSLLEEIIQPTKSFCMETCHPHRIEGRPPLSEINRTSDPIARVIIEDPTRRHKVPAEECDIRSWIEAGRSRQESSRICNWRGPNWEFKLTWRSTTP